MHTLYDLKDMLCRELEEYGKKDELTAGSLEVVDKLTHTIKNLDKIIEKYEDDEYSGESYEGMGGGSYARGRSNRSYERGGQSYERGGRSNERGGRSNRSYARGRGRNARRDSMGRYSGEYSGNEDMIMELRELMQDAPDERTRMEFEKFINKMEMM